MVVAGNFIQIKMRGAAGVINVPVVFHKAVGCSGVRLIAICMGSTSEIRTRSPAGFEI
jgi:hypothetical protein